MLPDRTSQGRYEQFGDGDGSWPKSRSWSPVWVKVRPSNGSVHARYAMKADVQLGRDRIVVPKKGTRFFAVQMGPTCTIRKIYRRMADFSTTRPLPV
jgi:hypothetical protein